MKKNTDLGILLLRITIAGLMLFHGIAKLGHLDGIKQMLSKNGLPEIMAYGVYITEIIAPILMIIGYRVKLASLTFFFGMVMALLLAHADTILALSDKGGLKIELILLYALGSLTLFFTGSGKYSISKTNKWN